MMKCKLFSHFYSNSCSVSGCIIWGGEWERAYGDIVYRQVGSRRFLEGNFSMNVAAAAAFEMHKIIINWVEEPRRSLSLTGKVTFQTIGDLKYNQT